MNMKKIEKKIVEIICDVLEIKKSSLKNFCATFNELEVDSLAFVNLIVSLESEFDFECDDDMMLMDAFKNIEDLIDYVKTEVYFSGGDKNG